MAPKQGTITFTAATFSPSITGETKGNTKDSSDPKGSIVLVTMPFGWVFVLCKGELDFFDPNE